GAGGIGRPTPAAAATRHDQGSQARDAGGHNAAEQKHGASAATATAARFQLAAATLTARADALAPAATRAGRRPPAAADRQRQTGPAGAGPHGRPRPRRVFAPGQGFSDAKRDGSWDVSFLRVGYVGRCPPDYACRRRLPTDKLGQRLGQTRTKSPVGWGRPAP